MSKTNVNESTQEPLRTTHIVVVDGEEYEVVTETVKTIAETAET